MLLLNPRIVRFGSAMWGNVAAVAIERVPRRVVEAFGDDGPYAVLVDVPEQQVRIKVVQEALNGSPAVPRPGDLAMLVLHVSPTAGDSGRQRLSTEAVVLSVEYEVSLKRGAIRTITLAAVSAGGAADPVTVTSV